MAFPGGKRALRNQYAQAFAQTQPQVSWDQLQQETQAGQQAALGTAEDQGPGVGDAIIRGGFQGLTAGYGDEIVAGLASIGDKGRYKDIRDTIRQQNRAAQSANPFTYGVADILGGLAPAIATGGATEAASGVEAGSAVARGALSGAAQGAFSGVGYSDAEGVGDILKDAATGAVIGGATGALAGKMTSNAVEGAENKAAQQWTKDVTAGADPTFRKRFLGQSDKISKGGDVTEQVASSRAVLEKDGELTSLLKKPHAEDAAAAHEIVDHTKSKLDELTSEVRPIYQKLDREAGQVPMGDVVDWMDNAIDSARRAHGKEALADALTDVRGDFVKVELAKAAKNGLLTEGADDVEQQIAKLSVPHQDIRQWVTGLLDEKLHKMGSLSETERFTLANEAHSIADKFLKAHLAAVEYQAPQLAADVAKLRDLNREIAVYAGTKQLFEHKVAKNLMRQSAWKEAANDRADQIAGVIGAAATGSPLGILQGIGIRQGVKKAGEAVRGLDKAATAALARVVKAAREGDPTASFVKKAIEVGVPAAAITSVLGVYRGVNDNLGAEQ